MSNDNTTIRAKKPRFVPSQRKDAVPGAGRWKATVEVITPTERREMAKTFDTVEQCQKWQRATIVDIERAAESGLDPVSVDPDLTLRKLINEYMESDAGRAVDVQVGAQIEWWKARLGHVRVVSISKLVIKKELEKCSAEGRAAATRNRYLSALRRVYRWALDLDEPKVSESPAHQVKFLPEDNLRCPTMQADEIIRMLELARADQWDRCYLWLLGLLHLGCRCREWLDRDWRDVDLNAGTVTLKTSKNGQPRVMTLTPAMLAELKAIQKAKPQIAGKIFPGIEDPRKHYRYNRPWARILKGLGRTTPETHLRVHDVRHIAASTLLAAGANLSQVGQVLGHKSLGSTLRYAHLDITAKRKLVDDTMAGLSLENSL